MDRIATATAEADLFGAGKDGFRNGNKALGIAATDLNAEWFNGIQENLAQFIESQGFVLDAEDYTLLTQAIKRAIAGGDYKPSVRAASTAAINLAAPGANIDGVAMVAGNRFLEKDHGTPALRGIYIYNGSATPATRASDADDGVEFNSGALIPVEEGTVNGNTVWMLTTDGVVTIGSTGLAFESTVVGAASTSNAGKVQLASTAEAQALVNALKALTPSTLADAFKGANQSLASNGYQKLPGGLILQWGVVSHGTGSSAVNISGTFPIAFPNVALALNVANYVSPVDALFFAGATFTVTGFTGTLYDYSSGAVTAGTAIYFAVGY